MQNSLMKHHFEDISEKPVESIRETCNPWPLSEKEPERLDARKTMTLEAYNDSFYTFYDRVNQKQHIIKKRGKGN